MANYDRILNAWLAMARDKHSRRLKVSAVGLVLTLFLLRQSLRKRTTKSSEAVDVSHASRKLYERNEDGSKTLLVPFRGRFAKVRIAGRLQTYLLTDLIIAGEHPGNGFGDVCCRRKALPTSPILAQAQRRPGLPATTSGYPPCCFPLRVIQGDVHRHLALFLPHIPHRIKCRCGTSGRTHRA